MREFYFDLKEDAFIHGIKCTFFLQSRQMHQEQQVSPSALHIYD